MTEIIPSALAATITLRVAEARVEDVGRAIARLAPADLLRIGDKLLAQQNYRFGTGARETFTVRKVSFGVGVERTFPVHSPVIAFTEVVSLGDVRRAKLYYLRDRVGRAAKIKERRVPR